MAKEHKSEHRTEREPERRAPEHDPRKEESEGGLPSTYFGNAKDCGTENGE
jgi:hypothetical protein